MSKKRSAVQEAELIKNEIEARELEIEMNKKEISLAQEILNSLEDGVRKEMARILLDQAQVAEEKAAAEINSLLSKITETEKAVEETNQLKDRCAEFLGVSGGFFDHIEMKLPFTDQNSKGEIEKLHLEITKVLSKANGQDQEISTLTQKLLEREGELEEAKEKLKNALNSLDMERRKTVPSDGVTQLKNKVREINENTLNKSIIEHKQYDRIPMEIKIVISKLYGELEAISI